jgi:hypothetical protein
MKKIVLVALLAAAAGCGSKKTGPDCEAAIAKGMENTIKVLKERVPNPQVVEANLGTMGKVKGVLIERCKADGWPPEVVSCFTTVSGIKDMESCQGKLTAEQASKLTTDLSKIMMGAAGMRMGSMPPGMSGHPEKLVPSNGSDATAGSPPAPGATAGSSDTPATPGAAAPAGSAAPASGSAPK